MPDIFIPPMIIQPFIENAIEHGFATMTQGGELKVSIAQKNEQLYIEIRDNGQGLRTDQEKKNYSGAIEYFEKAQKEGLFPQGFSFPLLKKAV